MLSLFLHYLLLCNHQFYYHIWSRGYKTFFLLNSAENEICSTYKKLNTKNLNFFNCTAEVSMNIFPANKY